MFGFYIWNNIRISFQAFAGGIALGLGSVFFLVYNGVHGGAVAGFLAQAGLGRQFWPFVATHSALELPALVLAGAAGLHLGWSLVARAGAPGPRRCARPPGRACPWSTARPSWTPWPPASRRSGRPAPWCPGPEAAAAAVLWAAMAGYFLLAGRRHA